MKLTIIDCGSGNLHSAAKAFELVAAKQKIPVLVTKTPEDLKDATHIVLPGVGAFHDCMKGLTSIQGMRDVLEEEVRQKKKPFFGICVGMQLLAEEGHEHGVHKGLGWLEGAVKAIKPSDAALKIPHMGWNDLVLSTVHPFTEGLKTGDHAYFVHSYAMVCEERYQLATVDYGGKVTAIVANENIVGAQFHPEKSQRTGFRLIENFLRMR